MTAHPPRHPLSLSAYFSLKVFRFAVLLTALLAAGQGMAQTEAALPCGTTEAMQQLLGADYDNWWQGFYQQLQQRQAQRQRPPGSPPAGPRYIVPLVVHIIHDNTANNISDDQVRDAVRLLNEVYQERHPDTAQVLPYFKSRIGNVNLEFRLARLDPDGNCTSGITRHYSALTNTAGENVKALPGARWPVDQYLNVWVVGTIASGAAGYAYYPCATPQNDGIVIRNDYFGSIGTTPNQQSRRYTFPHEVGHYLGLPHVWGSSNNPGPGRGNCNMDDGISDTPNTEGTVNGTCNLQLPSCPGDPDPISNVQNIMDYSGGCRSMFTAEQAFAMNDGFNGGYLCRTLLADPQNLTSTGVADGLTLPPCAPLAYLTATGAGASLPVQRVCEGDNLSFHGEAYNVGAGTAVTYQWSFPGGLPATSTAQDPVVTYPVPGTFAVSLQVSTAGGSDTTERAGYVAVQTTTGGASTPLVEGFEDPAFPVNTSDPLKTWELGPTADTNWEYTSDAAAVGTGSVRLQLRQTAQLSDYDLVSANIVASSPLLRPMIYFRNAYARQLAGNADELTVSYSFDCGRTWITRGGAARRTATALETAPPVHNQLFVPTISQWRQDSMLLQAGQLAAGTHLLVRFRVRSDAGNALYLDDVRVGSSITGLPQADTEGVVRLGVVPNPSDGQASMELLLAPGHSGTLRIYDAMGRRLGPEVRVADGEQQVALQSLAGRLPAGIYLVELTTGNGRRVTRRAMVQ